MILRPATASDREAIRAALLACRAFSGEEVAVAMEIFDSAVVGGLAGDYPTFVADIDNQARGYVCVGKTPLTQSTWHLYWLCIHPAYQHRGVARALVSGVEQFVRSTGGQRIVIETSGREDYARARAFYEAAGYAPVGRIVDFYKPGDDCVIYVRSL